MTTDTEQSIYEEAKSKQLSPEAVAALNVKLNAIRRKQARNPPQKIQWRGVQAGTYLAAMAWLDQHG